MDTQHSSDALQKNLPRDSSAPGGASPYCALIVDDDPTYCSLLQEYLGRYSFEFVVAHDGASGLETALGKTFDVILLDMFLPDLNGIEVLKAIRLKSSVPVIVLSAHNEETDRIVALEIGADDYVPKAFSSRELLARLRAVLRRTPGAVTVDNSSVAVEEPTYAEGELLTVRDISINKRTMEAFQAGMPLNLTNAEFQLLLRMIQEPGRIFTREHLLAVMHERDFCPFDRSIDMHISSLRRKLNDDSRSPAYIRTVRGAGYSFIPAPKP